MKFVRRNSNYQRLIEDGGSFGGMYMNEWRVARTNKLIEVFGEDWFKGKLILEMGCGFGNVGDYLSGLGATVHFSDARQECLDVVKEKNDEYETFLIDQETDWKHDEFYDLIIHWGLVYNMNYWERDLKKCLSMCKHLTVETAVNKFIEPIEYKIVGFEYQDSLHGPNSLIGSLPSVKLIENVFDFKGVKHNRYDDIINVSECNNNLKYNIEQEPIGDNPKYCILNSWHRNDFAGGRKFWITTNEYT